MRVWSRLWVSSKEDREAKLTSIDKLHQLFSLCESLAVHTQPAKIGELLWVVPLMSWCVG